MITFIMYLFVFVTEISSQTITSPSLSPQAQIQQYVISSRVFAGHQIPPIQQFSESKSYITGLLVFPIIIAVLGILSIFIFQSILCVRFCYHALCPSEHRECYNIASASEPDYERRKTYHSRSIIWFFTFIILTLITNCFVFIGDSLLSVSGRQASDSIVQLSNLFYDINSNANSISYDLGNMSALISTQPCYTYWNTIPGLYNQLIEQCQVGQSSAQSLAGVVGSTGTNLYDLNNVLTKTYLFYKSISVYSQFAIVTVSALLLITAYFVKLKWLLTTAIVLSLLMVLLMTFVGSALMLVTHGTADFCMAPANNTVLISPSSIKNISEYYTTCTGVGPFTYDYESTLTDLNILNSTINNPIAVQTLGQLSCYKSTQIELSKAYSNLYQIGNDIQCPYINGIYSNAVNSGICANAYDGVLGIFIVQLLTAAFLFFSLFGAIHFYEMWYPTHVMEGFGQADDEEGVLVVPFSAEYSTDKSSKLIVAKYEPVTSDTVYNDGYAQAATGGDSFYYSQPIAGNVQYNDQQQQYDQSGNYDQSSGYYSGGYDQPAGNTSSYPVEPAHYPSNHYSTYGNNYPAEEAI